MRSTAGEIQAAYEAGLILAGQDEEGRPEYMGKGSQWARFAQLLNWIDATGAMPWIEERV